MESVSLREFIERIFDEREKTLRLVADNLEHRLLTLNQLREDVIKDRALFVSKNVYDEGHERVLERLVALERWQSRVVGIGVVLVVIAGFGGAIITHLFK